MRDQHGRKQAEQERHLGPGGVELHGERLVPGLLASGVSRPANPAYTVPVWAPNASYPAGASPWSGTPTKTTHPAAGTTGITPRQGFPAQAMNKVLNDAYATDEAAKTAINDLVNHVGQEQVLNMGPGVTRGTAAGRGVWHPLDRAWWSTGSTLGSNDDLRYTTDRGQAWTTQSVGAAALTSPLTDMDVDAAGNMVILGGGVTTLIDYARSGVLAGTFTRRTVFSGTPDYPMVCHDPVRARWCIVSYEGGQKVYHSTSRASWTLATSVLPGTQRPVLFCNKTSGRLVAANTSSGTTVNIMTSDDGGQNWTLRSAVVSGFVSGVTTQPSGIDWHGSVSMAYSSTDGCWLMTVTNGTNTEIYRSTNDAVTWSLVRTLSGIVLRQDSLACIGRVWAAFGASLIYSVDQGATWLDTGWRPAAYSPASASSWLDAGGGGFLLSLRISTTGYSYPGFRQGAGIVI